MVSGLQQRGRGLFEYIRSMYYLRHRGNNNCHISWSSSRRSNRVPFWNSSLEVIEIPTEARGHCNVLVSFIPEKNLIYLSKGGLESHRAGLNVMNRKTKRLLETDSRLSSLLSHVID
jgi:hypothetical protein